MGVHYGNRPTGNDRMVPKLLNHYYGSDAAAAYSLRNLDYLKRNDPVVRVRRASDNAERDFTAEEVNSGGIENWSQALLTPGSYDSSRDVGYFGEVSSTDLISGDDLATELSLTAGTAQNSDAGWLKFYVGPNAFCNRQGNAYILYVAKRTMRHTVSWNDINSAGGVDGTTEVEIDGQSYSVRLMQGADADPSTFTLGTNCTDNPGENSEWNELLYRVSEKIPDCADPTEGMEGGFSTTRHGGPQNGSNWANFTNSELNVQVGNGRAAWCQEVDGLSPSRRVIRGIYGVASFLTSLASSASAPFGWRPCLQINLGQSGDVSAFVTTWYDQSGNDNHATQTTATEQPKIVDAGTLLSSFDVSDNNVYLEVPSITSTGTLITSTDSGTYDVQVNLSGGSHKIYTYHIWAIEQLLYYDRVIPSDEYNEILNQLQNNGFTIQQNFGTDWSNAFRDRPEIVSTANINIPAATSYESIFDGCTSLESAPQLDFSNVTRLNNSFRNSNAGAWLTASFFDETASGITQIAGFGGVFGRNGAFSNNPTITEIPTGFLDNCTGLISAAAGFENCNNLSSIPSNLFDNCPLITEFGGRYYVGFFEKCGLTSIPAGLFDNNPNVTSFGGIFNGNSITSIPAGLFDNNPNVTNFQGTFYRNLITSIPAGLFDNNSNVTSFHSTFLGNSITSIPAGLFDNNPNVTSFRSTFYINSITSIPAGLFDNNPNVTSFRSTFYRNSITSIPAGLFDNQTQCTNYNGVFRRNSLDQTSVDNVLVSVQTSADANNLNNGTLGIDGGSNATPSATGQAAADALRTRGWTVTLNGY